MLVGALATVHLRARLTLGKRTRGRSAICAQLGSVTGVLDATRPAGSRQLLQNQVWEARTGRLAPGARSVVTSMPPMGVIWISGLPGSGRSSAARWLAGTIKPCVYIDGASLATVVHVQVAKGDRLSGTYGPIGTGAEVDTSHLSACGTGTAACWLTRLARPA